jgi:putative endonuclease
MYFTYILECRGGTLYTGYTKNILIRYKEHLNGKGAKYTKYNPPLQLLYFESFDERKYAMRREREIKKYSKKKKLELCLTQSKSLKTL